MGARFDLISPVMDSCIKNGKILFIDFYGKEVSIPIKTKYEFDWDKDSFESQAYLKNVDYDNNRTIICRKDGTYSVWDNSDNLLLDYGKFDTTIFNGRSDSYNTIGYAKIMSSIYQVYIGEKVSDFIYLTIPNTYRCIRMLKVIKMPPECNTTVAYVKAEESPNTILDIFLFDGVNRLDWRDYFVEISSSII